MPVSKLDGLDRQELVAIIERIEELAGEAVSLRGYIDPAHGDGCHTRHAGCLGEVVMDVVEQGNGRKPRK